MLVIAFTGLASAGKTTSANICKEIFIQAGYEVVCLSFAAPLKEIAKILDFDIVDKQKINEFWGISSRQFLTMAGTELFLEEMPKIIPEMANVWCRLLDNKIRSASGPEVVFLIDDLRFPAEYDMLKKYNAYIINLKADVKKKINHKSEQFVLDYDYRILNRYDMRLRRDLMLIIYSLLSATMS